MRTSLLVLLLVSGCGGPSAPADVVGPFTGPLRRYYVSSITLPMQRNDFATDLNGDERVDNQLGNIVGGLAGQRDANDYVDEIVAARVIDATVDLISEDAKLVDDATVGVVWRGAAGEPADLTGGVLKNAILTTNRVQFTHHAPAGALLLPIFKDADPTLFYLLSYQVTLYDDGAGGFIGDLQGLASPDGLTTRAWAQFQQMMAAHPGEHVQLATALDKNNDGRVSLDEFTHGGLILNLTAPDVHWEPGDGAHPTGERNALSVAFGFTLTACIDEACTRPAAAPTCHDRIKNGDEQKVDCGGSCEACL